MTDTEATMLDELLDYESGMSEKELEFLDELDWCWRLRELSDKQHDWLEGIFERVIR